MSKRVLCELTDGINHCAHLQLRQVTLLMNAFHYTDLIAENSAVSASGVACGTLLLRRAHVRLPM